MAGRLGFQLLAELGRSPFASNAELGRRLGVSGEAVRQRLQRFTEEGVLRGFSAVPAPGVFGRRSCDLVFPSPADLDLLLRQADVVFAVNSVDGRAGVKGYVHDAAAFARRMGEALGETPREIGSGSGAGPKEVLSTIDLRVLRALIKAPRASFQELQSATGLSYRTVRSSRQRLIDSGAVLVQPVLRPSRSGDLYHNLWVQGPACVDEETVLGLLDEGIVLDRWEAPPSLYLFCHEDGLEAHFAMLERLRRAPGIGSVEVVMSKEYRMAEERVLGWLDERLAAWRGAASPASGE